MRTSVLISCLAVLASPALLAGPGHTQGTAPAGGTPAAVAAPSPRTPELARSRVLGVLEKRCAGCHQADRARASGADTGLRNILALDDIVREPTLVEPGRPDASRLYHVLLSRHVRLSSSGSGDLTPEDKEAVRDWIETMPPMPPGCPDRPRVTDEEALSLMQAWRRDLGSAWETRFVSLAHLSNACVGEAVLSTYRDEAMSALAGLAGRSQPAGVEAIGDLSVVLAVRLSEAGLTPETWKSLEAAAPRLIGGAVPADWLAHHAGGNGAPSLTRRYREDVGIRRAAAELGVEESALSERLSGVEGPDGKIARQLRQGLVSRDQWEQLARVLAGRPPETGTLAVANLPLRLGLWSDKTIYKSGDLASLTATASEDCYLTLIGVDRAGNATVLFPNDFEQQNLLRGGSSLTIPLQSATYQLRVRDRGTETVIGICSTVRRRPDGVLHEFERQRFTVLGNWRVFLETADKLEAEISRSGQGKSRRQAKSGSSGALDAEARTAIEFKVE